MFGMLEHRPSMLGEAVAGGRRAGSDEQGLRVSAVMAEGQRGIEQRRRDPAASGCRIDHAGELDGGWPEGVQTDEADEAVTVPPQRILDVVT